jgi:hypothetical protein
LALLVAKPRATCLTRGLAQLIFQASEHLLDGTVAFVGGSQLLGRQAQSGGHIVLAAVLHHAYLDASG